MVTTNTAGRLPEETMMFEVAATPQQKEVKNGYMRWHFEFLCEAGTLKLSFFDNELGELLAVLGCKESKPKVFDWEPEELVGISFIAEHFLEMGNGGKMFSKLRNFQQSDKPKTTSTPADIKWEE